MKSYITQVNYDDDYSFISSLDSKNYFNYEIRIKLSLNLFKNSNHYRKRMQKVVEVEFQNVSIVKLNTVVQNKSLNLITLTYQHDTYSLMQWKKFNLKITKIQIQINKICVFLINKGIIPNLQLKFFGLNQDSKVKYLLLPNFNEIQDQYHKITQLSNLQVNIENFLKKIGILKSDQIQDDISSLRISQKNFSLYNKKFEQKITYYENKLLKSRIERQSCQKLKKRKKLSNTFSQQNLSISSQSSRQFSKSNKQKIMVYINKLNNIQKLDAIYPLLRKTKLHNNNSKQSSQQSHAEIQDPQVTEKNNQKQQKLTNSLIMQQNSKNQPIDNVKHHKSSFGDYSTYGNQSEKDMKLKRRISCALEKSQLTLKVYEKYQLKRKSKLKK